MASKDSEPDVVTRLSWGLRRYLAVVMAAVLAAVMLSLSRPTNGPDQTYEAAALVIASSLEINPLQLPRTVEAVFTAGSVEESVASQLPDAGPAHRLIPDVVRLEALNDTIVVRVIGVSDQPWMAAVLANVAASSLVEELNRLGPGVGKFVLYERARPPLGGTGSSSMVIPIAVGIVSGAAMGLGLVGLLLLMLRPVITGSEAAAIVGAPTLISLDLPARGSRHQLTSMSGLSLLTKQLFPAGTGSCALVDTGSDTGPRLRVMRLVAQLLGCAHPVDLVVPSWERRALTGGTQPEPNVRVLDNARLPPSEGSGVRGDSGDDRAVLFGLSARGFDVPQLIPGQVRIWLVVKKGSRREQVESASRQFLPGDVHGIVFVKRASWLRRPHRKAGTVDVEPPPVPSSGDQAESKTTSP